MKSPNSDELNSNSGTTESDRQIIKKGLTLYQYPPMPTRNFSQRHLLKNGNKLLITTNLYELKLIDQIHKFTLFSLEILPEIANDNFILKKQIYFNIETNLPKSFKKLIWAGNNLYAFITQDTKENYNNIEINEEINGVTYNIKLKKVEEISFQKINDFNGPNQKIKTIIENLFRNILLRNPNVLKFHDRTIFEIDRKNIINIDNQNKDHIYKGYITAAVITENGLYMQINNRSKFISGKTALEKINEIKNKCGKNVSILEINDKIKDYFYSHRTVLTTYGSLRVYKIKEVDFDQTPKNTDVTFKDNEGKNKTIRIINYYKNQYDINIKDINQPLFVVENNNSKKNKKLPSSDKNKETNNDYIIYLLPELVYITGIEDDDNPNNRRNKGRNIISKTKMDPSKKMEAINNINNLINSDNHKKIKRRNGQVIEMKSAKELIKEWGINIGDNLSFLGRIIPQPQLHFKNNCIFPKNGIFRADKPYESEVITNDNIFYVYDINERNCNHRDLFTEIMLKFRTKEFNFASDFHPNKVCGYGLENTNNWESIDYSLRKIKLKDQKALGIIFCSRKLEKFYGKLKYFFTQQYHIPTQFLITDNIKDSRRGNSVQFNIVDQINIKMGGTNYYIDFKSEGIIKNGEVFLIIGLDSKTSNKKITYSMTSTNNSKLSSFVTQEETCDNRSSVKNETLKKMFETAIDQINRRSPHCPDYIIIYRQGGNEIHNKILTVSELENFTEILNIYRERFKNKNNFNFRNTKLYYICCNLKSDLKFFETQEHDITKAYFNPKSGLIVDDNVTHKNKYEFYLQPQFVNQGTATPCHYQVMYYDKDQKEENNLTIENLEKLSFYLSFYYWTWAGAIRTPSLLKMSSTALAFYSKIFDNQGSFFFSKPTYI